MAVQDAVAAALLLAAVGLSLGMYFRRKKRGSGCCGGCSACPYAAKCGKKQAARKGV